MAASRKKLVIVGDSMCGKTCLLDEFTGEQFTREYIPTLCHVVANINADVELAMWSTSGHEDHDRMRHFCYRDTDVIILCFSIDSPNSLENILERWMPEVKDFCPNSPIILVGNKKVGFHCIDLYCQAQVPSPKVKTTRAWADTKITWATHPTHNF